MSASSPPIHEYRMVMNSVDLHIIHDMLIRISLLNVYSPPSFLALLRESSAWMLGCFLPLVNVFVSLMLFISPNVPTPSLCPPSLDVSTSKAAPRVDSPLEISLSDSFIRIHRHHTSLSLPMRMALFPFYFYTEYNDNLTNWHEKRLQCSYRHDVSSQTMAKQHCLNHKIGVLQKISFYLEANIWRHDAFDCNCLLNAWIHSWTRILRQPA